jgi:tripartite ATP-independent transporter DctP family solute receptor
MKSLRIAGRRRPAVLAVFTFAVGLALGPTPAAYAKDPEIIVRMGWTTAPDSIIGDEHRLWANLVDVNSGGRILIKGFPSALLGKENTQIEGLVSGTHDVLTHISMFTGKIKEQRFWDLPFLFKDQEVVARLVDGPLRAEMEEHFRKNGMELLGFWGLGYRQFTGNARPIRVPEDLKGTKHRIPGGKSKMMLFQALGANPSTISFPELYQALKTGVVDSQDNPLTLIYTSKFHEVTKYLSLCNYVYNPVITAAGQPFWKKLPEWAKPILKKAARDVEGWSRMLSEKIDYQYLQKIKAETPKIQINTCDPKDIPKWKAAAKPVYDAFVQDAGKEWAEKVFRVVDGGYAN